MHAMIGSSTPRMNPSARWSRASRFLPVLIVALPAILAWTPGTATAGTFHESFAHDMNMAAAGQTLTGLVALSSRLEVDELEREMDALGIESRWRRHEYVVRAAKKLASRTQPAVIDAMAGNAAGRVVSIRPFWIANLLAVEAEVAVFEALAQRGDVEVIFADAEIEIREGWDEPAVSSTGFGKNGRSLQDGLIAVNVEHAWDLGYTGEGRLVCSFDTGAQGEHPAYSERWRGLDPEAEWHHAWKDPYTLSEFPFDSGSHGTHVLGIMAGHPPGEDPLGVAYEADWMAAGILIGWNVQKILECYEWAVDPDGNPSTIRDVPDVINNSWGTSANCDPTYWDAIDLVEAAGIVNVIAVDNSGPGYASVNSPESRAASPYVNFGVGNLNPHDPYYPISPSSGRGPSPCDSSSVKPELTAPGTQIYSSIPNGYGTKSGTSMAAPHVSGAAAILRQVNPSLTVEQIKEVLMNTALDLGDLGEDNTYGWGMLNVGAAVDLVLQLYPPAPSPRNLAANSLAGGVALTWQPPLDPPPGNSVVWYHIYRAEDGEPYPAEPFASVSPFPTHHVDQDRPAGAYRYVVTAEYAGGAVSEPSNEALVTVTDPTSGLAGREASAVGIFQASPNPFRSGTDLRLQGSASGAETVSIFDPSGRLVRSLRLVEASGAASAVWDGRDEAGRSLPAGTYFARPAGGEGRTLRLVLVR